MNSFVLVSVLLAVSTAVLAQNPYEYVDDALIQKVGQIVFDYDQKVAASRSVGGRSLGSSVSSGYQFSQPEPIARVNSNSNNYVAPALPQRQQRQYNYNQVQQRQVEYQAPVPVQRTYQPVAVQQQVYQAPVARTYQPVQQQVYQAPVARTYQPVQVVQAAVPVVQVQQQQQTYQPAVVSRKYEQPQQKSFGYNLNQPEAVQMVAEWHDTLEGEQKVQNNYGSLQRAVSGVAQQQQRQGRVNNNYFGSYQRSVGGVQQQQQADFRLA